MMTRVVGPMLPRAAGRLIAVRPVPTVATGSAQLRRGAQLARRSGRGV